MKKRILALLLSALMLASVTACNNSTSDQEVGSTTETPQEELQPNPITDFEYSATENGGVWITKYVGSNLNVVIPEQIEEKNVIGIGEKAFYKSTITSLVMPDTITQIEYMAFCECQSLATVSFSKNLVCIDISAFSDCTSLKEADLSMDTLHSIETAAFSNCVSLETVIFGKNITRILAAAFYNCQSLKEIILPENLQEIGDVAFAYCSEAKEIFIPKTIEIWGTFPFEEVPSVTNITFEDGLKTIGGSLGLFKNCQVKELTIPSSIESIGYAAFWDAHSLEKIYFEGNAPMIDDVAHTFHGSEHQITCYYDSAASGWDTTPLRNHLEMKTK